MNSGLKIVMYLIGVNYGVPLVNSGKASVRLSYG